MKLKITIVFLWVVAVGLWIFVAADMKQDSSSELTVVKNSPENPDTSAPRQLDPVADEVKTEKKCININNASVEELDDLPGVGPVIAQRIIEYRNNTGLFSRLSDVDQVKGIGPAKLRKMEDRLCF